MGSHKRSAFGLEHLTLGKKDVGNEPPEADQMPEDDAASEAKETPEPGGSQV